MFNNNQQGSIGRVCRPVAALAAAFGILTISTLMASAQGVSITTFHGDNARLGWNSHEIILTPATVNQSMFGKAWQVTFDGTVCGSPLYVAGVSMANGAKDVVYAATNANSVYALDAVTGNMLWSRQRLASPVTNLEYWGGRGDGLMGILSTPVIDAETGTIYVCGVHRKGLRQLHLVWALDIRTGAVKPGWPVTLKGKYKGLTYVAGQGIQRGGLTLLNGWVYIPFGGRGDAPPWHGWIMGIDTKNPAAPQRTFSASTTTDGAGIWSGGGLSADDSSGMLYAVTGNGVYDLDKGGDNLSQTIFRLNAADGGLQFSHDAKDYYTPTNYQHLDEEDEDLGGATAIILPDMPGTSTPHLLYTGGKDGVSYLINRDNMGGLGSELQKMALFVDPKADYQEGIRATAAYFDGGDAGRFIYVAGDGHGPDGGGGMVALQLTTDTPNGPARFKKAWSAKSVMDHPDSPVVSSDGMRNGILWMADLGDRTALRALDAVTGKDLYNSEKGAITDRMKDGQTFVSPTVANGRVYVGTRGIVCYGLKASVDSGGAK